MAEKQDSKVKRMQIRLSEEDANLIASWSETLNLNKTDFILAAVKHYVHFQQGNYDLQSAEVKRLNQLVDISHLQTQAIYALDQTVKTLMKTFYRYHTGSIPHYLNQDATGLMSILNQQQVDEPVKENVDKEIKRLNRVKFKRKK